MGTFKEHPTLDDLKAFAVEQDTLLARLRAARRKSYDAHAEGTTLNARVTQSVVRKFKRVENVGDGRDLAVHHNSSKLAQRAKELYGQAAEAEREATEIDRLIERSRAGRQMEAYDYDLYLSEGLELPPHRRALYERNAYAKEHAPELLSACESAYDFLDTLASKCSSEPEVLGTLRAAVGIAQPSTKDV